MRSPEAHITATLSLLGERLEVLVHNSNGKNETSSSTGCTEEVSKHGKSTNAESTEASSRHNISVKLTNHSIVT